MSLSRPSGLLLNDAQLRLVSSACCRVASRSTTLNLVILITLVLVDLLEAQNVLRETLCRDRLAERAFDGELAHEFAQKLSKLAHSHLLAADLFIVEQVDERLRVDGIAALVILVVSNDSFESLFDIVLSNAIHWPVVDEQLDECVKVDVEIRLAHGSVGAETHFIHHVVDFLRRWVVAHGAHQVWKLVNGDPTLELSRLCSVLLLRANHRVVEEVINILVGLAFCSSLDKLDKGLDAFSAHCNGLLNG